MIIDRKVTGGHSKRAVRATIWAGINTLIPMITSFGVLVVTSRMLTPRDFGIVALASSLALLGSSLCPNGFGEAIVQRLDLSPKHLDTVFWLCMGCGCTAYALECEIARTAAGYFKIDAIAVLVPVVSLKILSDMAGVVPTALIARSMSFQLFALRSLIASLIAAALTIGLLLKGFGLWSLVVSQLISSFVTAVVGFSSAGWRPRFNFSFTALKEIASYGAYSSATTNLLSLATQNEQIFVVYFVGTAQLGFYNFAKRVIGVLNNLVVGSLGAVAHPMFSGLQTELERVHRGFLSATFISTTISFPVFLGLALSANHIVPLVFGPHWASAVVLVKIQCALGLSSCIGTLQSGLINSQGKANWWFYYQLAQNVGNILTIVLFARFGVEILMIAMVVRTYVLLFIPVRLTLILLSMRAREYFWNFKAPLTGSLLMVLSVLAERHTLPDLGNATGLGADILVGGIAYLIGILLSDRPRVLFALGLFVPRLKYLSQ